MLSKSSKASSYGVCYYRYHYYTSINSSTLWTCRSVNPAMHTWWLASSLANNLQNIYKTCNTAAMKGRVLICLCKYKCKHIEKGTFAIFEQPPVFAFTLRQFEHAKMYFLCVTGSLDLEFHYFSLHQEIYYFSIILLLIFLRLGISGFDLASLCIA